MTEITGHRGARALWPENSRTGFRQAVKLGCDAIEFDVHLTRAGELVVIHDPTLERTTEGTGRVAELSPAARAATRLKGSDESIPTLDEVLDILAPSGVRLHVEIKLDAGGDAYPGLAGRVAERLVAHGVAGRAHLTSFDMDVLRACRDHSPEIPRLVSADAAWVEKRGGLEEFLSGVRDLADIVALRHDYFAQVFDQVTGLWPRERLCAWTINEPELLRDWLARDIGHLTTDRPDLALALRPVAAV
ncbi:glycerophosphodiester phosphodiesterase family protein [Celeribacter indicus]|uniref:Glycerophosphoryl diester phosphodiesterase n=1 Tax=Celeribacter indicus TaxID=1208324 RepID=A0A0B5DXV5_9RHOB|nr:glycerophosphodiester phosphodiesterase family protein [Celeribacter indicus]AJE47829.1 glycerophosphoryl diester phosphodiesterase [Celeribacter indicus]SDW24232.1 glycerophosphoryl diester phosphodiesterase [Celeribacter indicus]